MVTSYNISNAYNQQPPIIDKNFDSCNNVIKIKKESYQAYTCCWKKTNKDNEYLVKY